MENNKNLIFDFDTIKIIKIGNDEIRIDFIIDGLHYMKQINNETAILLSDSLIKLVNTKIEYRVATGKFIDVAQNKNTDLIYFNVTKVYVELDEAYRSGLYRGFVLTGGLRSSKTTSIIQFIINYCANKRHKNILIVRNKYRDLLKSTLKDFENIIGQIKLDRYIVRIRNGIYTYNNNTICFGSLDNELNIKHDVVWFSEGIEIKEKVFDDIVKNTKEIFIIDFNNIKDSWVEKKLYGDTNIFFHKSSCIDNPFLPKHVRDEILAYDSSNPINVKN